MTFNGKINPKIALLHSYFACASLVFVGINFLMTFFQFQYSTWDTYDG